MRIVAALCLAFLVGFFPPNSVYAQNATRKIQGNGTPELIDLAKRLQPMAAVLGAPEIAWVNLSPDRFLLIMEFLPPGQKLEDWREMVTVHMRNGPANDEKKTSEMNAAMIEGFRKTIVTKADVGRFDLVRGRLDTAAIFDFVINAGPTKEYNVGTIFRAEDRKLLTVLLQKRDVALTDAQKNMVWNLSQK